MSSFNKSPIRIVFLLSSILPGISAEGGEDGCNGQGYCLYFDYSRASPELVHEGCLPRAGYEAADCSRSSSDSSTTSAGNGTTLLARELVAANPYYTTETDCLELGGTTKCYWNGISCRYGHTDVNKVHSGEDCEIPCEGVNEYMCGCVGLEAANKGNVSDSYTWLWGLLVLFPAFCACYGMYEGFTKEGCGPQTWCCGLIFVGFLVLVGWFIMSHLEAKEDAERSRRNGVLGWLSRHDASCGSD